MKIPQHQPGITEVPDLEAEAARLSEQRRRETGPWFPCLGEICDMPDGERVLVQVSATRPVRFPAHLGVTLGAVVAHYWPASHD